MSKLYTIVKNLVSKALSYLPTPLPIGMSEFDAWATSVIALSRLPDNDSIRYTLATMIPHQKAERDRIPKALFVSMMHKAAANQIAMGYAYDLKEKQKAAIEAAKAAEATALNAEASGGQETQQA